MATAWKVSVKTHDGTRVPSRLVRDQDQIPFAAANALLDIAPPVGEKVTVEITCGQLVTSVVSVEPEPAMSSAEPDAA